MSLDKDLEFIKAINNLYNEMYHSVGFSSIYIEDKGLQLAHNLFEYKHPDKYTKAREIQKEIDSKKVELDNLLNSNCDDYCDD